MKFKNITDRAIRVAGYGWVQPGETLEVPASDADVNGNLASMADFEVVKAAAKKTTTKSKS